jgi:nucleoside-diphosphate-sugar epimerase
MQVMTDFLYDVNVNGTRAVIAACTRSKSVRALVYTSSIDVTFDGRPVLDGTEDRPYPQHPDEFNGYIHSKVLAERHVLAANSPGLRTAALRPSHIYGPGDPMIPLVVDLVSSGGAPFMMGDGRNVNDYVFVDNVATGHVQCAHSMLTDVKSPVSGRAIHLSDFHANIWEFMRPFLASQGLEPPLRSLPLWVGVALGSVLDAVQTTW